MKSFPGPLIGYFSSGTGFAGLFGSGSLILLALLKVPTWAIYLLAAPTIIPYFLCFYWMEKMRKTYPYDEGTKESEVDVEEKAAVTAQMTMNVTSDSADTS